MEKKLIAVFGSSDVTPQDEAYEIGIQVGRLLAERGYGVLNGGYAGIMEASSKGAKSCGGHTVGITTKDIDRRPPNPYNDEVVPAGRLIERIDELVSRADGFIVAQGGVGTLCEMFLAWNLNLLGIDKTPIVLLGDYWNNVLSALAENIMITPEEHLIHLKVAETPSEAVDMICDYFD